MMHRYGFQLLWSAISNGEDLWTHSPNTGNQFLSAVRSFATECLGKTAQAWLADDCLKRNSLTHVLGHSRIATNDNAVDVLHELPRPPSLLGTSCNVFAFLVRGEHPCILDE